MSSESGSLHPLNQGTSPAGTNSEMHMPGGVRWQNSFASPGQPGAGWSGSFSGSYALLVMAERRGVAARNKPRQSRLGLFWRSSIEDFALPPLHPRLCFTHARPLALRHAACLCRRCPPPLALGSDLARRASGRDAAMRRNNVPPTPHQQRC
jgi:hypothetical protein